MLAAHPTLADVIPAHDLARAARLAFDTLLSILQDTAAAPRERRMAATAVLRVAMPQTSPGRKPGVNSPRAQPLPPTPPPTPASAHAPATPTPHPRPAPHAPPADPLLTPTHLPPALFDTTAPPLPRRAFALLAAAGTALDSPLHPRAA